MHVYSDQLVLKAIVVLWLCVFFRWRFLLLFVAISFLELFLGLLTLRFILGGHDRVVTVGLQVQMSWEFKMLVHFFIHTSVKVKQESLQMND